MGTDDSLYAIVVLLQKASEQSPVFLHEPGVEEDEVPVIHLVVWEIEQPEREDISIPLDMNIFHEKLPFGFIFRIIIVYYIFQTLLLFSIEMFVFFMNRIRLILRRRIRQDGRKNRTLEGDTIPGKRMMKSRMEEKKNQG